MSLLKNIKDLVNGKFKACRSIRKDVALKAGWDKEIANQVGLYPVVWGCPADYPNSFCYGEKTKEPCPKRVIIDGWIAGGGEFDKITHADDCALYQAELAEKQ